METSQIYILISIIILLLVAIIIFFVKRDKKKERLSKLGGLSLIFVLAGMLFGDNRLRGYSLIGIGVLLAVIDIFIKLKSNKKKHK